MALRDKYETEIKNNKQLQAVALANTKGIDYTPIGDESKRPEFKPSTDLVNNEKKLKESRGYELGGGPSDYKGAGTVPGKNYSKIHPRD